MNDFFKKLNVLVKASLNELVDPEGAPRLALGRREPDVEQQLHMLQQRVDDALKYEDDLVARVSTLQAEVERWDRQADEAVAQGQGDTARRAAEQLQRGQQRLAMAESDLHEHRLVTQELISRVNQLKAVVDQVKREQPASPTQPEDTLERAGKAVNDVLQEMRDKIAEMSEKLGPVTPPPDTSQPEPPADNQSIEDDLARRRERLSKK